MGKLTLTRDDISALRDARAVTFHTDTADGRAVIRAHIDYDFGTTMTAKSMRLFPDHNYAKEFHRELACEAGISDYDRKGDAEYTCYEMLHGTRYDIEWQTVVDALKVGDEVAIGWVASNNNGILKEAGLHNDELHLNVWRTTKSGNRQHRKFFLSSRVCQDNSARLVRRTLSHANA